MRIAVIVGLLAVGISDLRAEDAAANPSDQHILVLRNGQILEGRIVPSKGLYTVYLPYGEIRVKEADVELICSSMEDGYQRKRALIQVGNVTHHLELAQWCLRHQLWGHAATELADAKVADATNPMIGVLENRLKMVVSPPDEPETKPQAVATGPSNDELDRMIRGMPHGAVETFTQSVQPLLMNHCTASGCHGFQSETNLKLIRIPTGKAATKRLTQRNLASVLQFIDRENPMGSKLLKAPSGPHGTLQHAIFSEKEAAQFQKLAVWAYQVASQPMPELPATVTPTESEQQAGARGLQKPPQVLSQEARKGRPLSTEREQTAKTPNARPDGERTSETAPASFQEPADPMDPEIFNRQYAPQKARE